LLPEGSVKYQIGEQYSINMGVRLKPEKFWDTMANKLDKTEKRLEQIFTKVLKNTKTYLNATDVVLDYGCGTGLLCNEIAGNVKQIYAIDISSKMLDIAKRRAVERNIDNVEFAQADISDTRYKRESFDVILAFGILHYGLILCTKCRVSLP
jgi:2-polyprenyl-3-methyl-5-hydroxy-6-metoxy-1,4-benzoquinol methylase